MAIIKAASVAIIKAASVAIIKAASVAILFGNFISLWAIPHSEFFGFEVTNAYFKVISRRAHH